MKKLGLFIGRMNPPHLGHISVINSSIENDDITVVLLGSSNISNDKNPLSYFKRKDLLETFFNKSVIITDIDDYPNDEKWVEKINNKLFELLGTNNYELTIYGGDLENDYAVKVIKYYEKKLLYKNISYKEINRKNLKINYKGENILLSSTLLRKTIIKNDNKFVELIMGKKMYKYYSK